MDTIHYETPELPIYCAQECLREGKLHSHMAHIHQDIEIIAVEHGKMQCQTGADTFPLTKGDICFINRKQMHALYEDGKDVSRHRVLLVGNGLLTQNPLLYDKYFRPMLEDPAFSHIRFAGNTSHAAEIHGLMEEIGTLDREKRDGYELEILSRFYEILRHLYLAYSSTSEQPPVDRNALIQERMGEYIYEHYRENLTLDDIAKAGNVSRSMCSKLFKEYTRLSPISFLNNHRLEVSRDLLRTTSDSIAEIALSCGFSEQSYFNRLFMRAYGVTPSVYRKNFLT